MPKHTDSPVPRKRFHGGRWRIFWKWSQTQYSIPTSFLDQEKTTSVDADLRLISAALAMDSPEFPEAYKNNPVVLKYLEDRFPPSADEKALRDSAKWLSDYEVEIRQECEPSWATTNMTMLKALQGSLGDLGGIAPDKLSRYLADIQEHTSIATRNRTRNAFSRFYNWATRTKRLTTHNPVAEIPVLPEPRITDIVYCTLADREEFISLAHRTGMSEWLAVPIAFYSGMRREEIAKLRWEDIRFGEGTIVVVETKTKTSRTLPLNSTLDEYLRLVPRNRRFGYVVDSPNGYNRIWRLATLVRKMQKIQKAAFLAKNPKPGKKNTGRRAEKKYEELKAVWQTNLMNELERIGWTPFRHTFASLLVQGGVTIDKVSAWMGNTPEVCRRHYAQFIPRDKRDSEIDRL